MAINIFFHLFILLSMFAVCRSQYNATNNKQCFYILYVSTGTLPDSGTNSTISLEIWDETGYGYVVADLARDGFLTTRQYDYFEKGHIDYFRITSPPLRAHLCAVKFTCDGKGSSWYLNFAELTYSCLGWPVQQLMFPILSWLAPDPPYKLNFVKSFCGGKASHELPAHFTKAAAVPV